MSIDNSMQLWRLTRRFGLAVGGDPWRSNGGVRGMIIVAESEAAARQCASENGGKENQWLPKLHMPGEEPTSPWLNKCLTDCELLTLEGRPLVIARNVEETEWDWDN